MDRLDIRRQMMLALPVILISVLHALAQNGRLPSPDDPVLYLLFLGRYERFYSEIEAARPNDPERARIMKRSLAEEMNLREDDFPKVSLVQRRLAAKFEVIDAEANAYRDSVIAKKEKPDIAIIKGFSDRRDQALSAAIAELQQALGPTAWGQVKAYITEPFRYTVRVGGAGK